MATRKKRTANPQRATLASTEAELDAAAEITAADMDDAAEYWREKASPSGRGMIDATPYTKPGADGDAP